MSNPNWQTPKELFDLWNEHWKFTVDAAASDINHLLSKYWTLETDGLKQDWSGERVFCNPPYSSNVLGKWVVKAAEHKADVAFLLLPANVDTAWFHDCIYNQEDVDYYFWRGRIAFGDPDGTGKIQPRYPNLIAIFHGRP